MILHFLSQKILHKKLLDQVKICLKCEFFLRPRESLDLDIISPQFPQRNVNPPAFVFTNRPFWKATKELCSVHHEQVSAFLQLF